MRRIVFIILALIVMCGIGYLALPAFSLTSVGFWWFMFGICCTAAIFALFNSFIEYDYGIPTIVCWISPFALLLIIAIVALIGSPVFNAGTYRETITVAEGEFSVDYEDISDLSSYTTMDLDTARRLGDRVLGNVPNATWYEIDGEYNLILYQGKQYRISPLNYGDVFKYLKAKNVGIPGYVLVDCESSEARFVQTTEPIRYSPSACFGYDLKRVLRVQFPTYVFDSHFMEIDEEGTPYWVSAVTEKQSGLWCARKVTKFVLTNACTGKSKVYSLEEKPEWLDHVYSLDYMMQVAKWHYSYVNGWWNMLFSKTGVLRTTYSYSNAKKGENEPNFYGYNSFVNRDGDVMVFTGITPANRTESNVGFLTINASNGKFVFYRIPGAEESSAQAVVEGLIQNMGYQATYPFMVNVAGHPTYLMNLKDKSGLIQRYAMVNLENYTIAYVGMDFAETLSGYLSLLGIEQLPETDTKAELAEIVKVSGMIEQKFQAEMDGTTYFYYIIDGNLYRASIKINEEQVMFQIGDNVTIEAYQQQKNILVVKNIIKR